MTSRAARRLIAVLLVLAIASLGNLARLRVGRAELRTAPTQRELTAADTSAINWLTATHGYSGWRHSPLTQVTPRNARRLKVACSYRFTDTPSLQTSPLVYRGTIIVTTPFMVAAVDGETCRERWRQDVRYPATAPANRGAALGHGLVVFGTAFGSLAALDVATGSVRWQRQIGNPAVGETLTMPPLIFDSLVLIGPAGSENGVRGWIGAFRLADGRSVWRTSVIDTSTWAHPDSVPVGGGAVWTPMTLDAATATLFVPTANPAPAFTGEVREGDNLHTNSLVALDAHTGAVRWHRQLLSHDTHDWDLTQAGPLLRHAVITAGKDGVVRAVDRESHDIIWETPVTTRSTAAPPPGLRPTLVCPGVYGGVAWHGPAYSPGTNMLYVPAIDYCTTYQLTPSVRRQPGKVHLGGVFSGDPSGWQGWLTALDATTGAVRWRYRSPDPVLGPATVTAGGVVLTGEMSGDLLVLHAATGEVLHRHRTPGPVGGGIVSYAVDRRQFIAVASGKASALFPNAQRGEPTLTVLTLP